MGNDFGGAVYGEKMWLTGAANQFLSTLLGPSDACCGNHETGGCGKCLLIQNPDSIHPDWTAVVMKKNVCPAESRGCGDPKPHFDIAAPGFDWLSESTANICGRPGTGFGSREESGVLGKWSIEGCGNTASCAHKCDGLPVDLRKGCRLFASWGWTIGNPGNVKFRQVACPQKFRDHVGQQFGKHGVLGA